MKCKNIPVKFFAIALMLSLFFQHASAQNPGTTVYQYRRVAEDKIDEFVKRETTYWSKVAQKAVDAKKLTFWALLEKVGGYDLPNSSNFLFINTYTDIDKAGDVWNNVEATAGVKIAQMETGSMSTTTSMFFLHEEDWAQAAKAVPASDFNYVVMVYHNSNYPDSLISLEKTYWHPFIQKAMDNHQVPQLGWGNAMVLTPSGDNIKFNTVSYDLFKTLKDALMPKWDPAVVLPMEGLTKIGSIETNRRGSAVYRVVKVITAN